MKSSQLAQRIQDEQGYLIIVYDEEVGLPYVFTMANNTYCDDSAIETNMLAFERTTIEDWIRQRRKYCPDSYVAQKDYTDRELNYYFYKVRAE